MTVPRCFHSETYFGRNAMFTKHMYLMRYFRAYDMGPKLHIFCLFFKPGHLASIRSIVRKFVAYRLRS